MNHAQAKACISPVLPGYEKIALVLQGGGALGAYQAGVYNGLDQVGIQPNWIAGISIGALNTAIIAGNPVEHRSRRLREFWEFICHSNTYSPFSPWIEYGFANGSSTVRQGLSAWQAAQSLLDGQRGFFTPRLLPPLFTTKGSPTEASYYNTGMLKSTLENFADFDRINSGEIRVSLGAVNIRTGNFAYFDNTQQRLQAEHFMASGALPSGFPAIEIDGEYYWDGGLVSNTPLREVINAFPRQDTLAFQVDLWSAEGVLPNNINEVMGRQKEIQYSSRTRSVTDNLQQTQHYRQLLRELLKLIPSETRDHHPWCQKAQSLACEKRYNIIHLIYSNKEYEPYYKDFQFGISTMREHWESGLKDIQDTLAQPGWLELPEKEGSFVTHDIHRIQD